jgi:hypothetical protein
MSLFGTKAETLEHFRPLLTRATIPDLLYFTVREYHAAGCDILARIRQRFGEGLLAVRSSAFHEDGAAQSLAGAFHSCLNVDGSDPAAVRAAIEAVIAHYRGDPRDQVLVQPMLQDVALSGVIMTYDLQGGAPYYILNYDDESGQTDRITGGTGVNKTVMVYRGYDPAHVESPRVAAMLAVAQELEALSGGSEPLDIEFAQTRDGAFYVLQARRITVQQNWNRQAQAAVTEAIPQVALFFAERARSRPDLYGDRTILGQMPDWNPAEIIGTQPRPLAVSLYRRLVTDRTWQIARERMGYRVFPPQTLMIVLANQPYIDVRNSFNSFLPADLDAATGHTLVNAWLDRLHAHPEFHDKVEFQIAQTALDFTFDQDFAARYEGVLSIVQRDQYREALQQLTRKNVSLASEGSLCQALAQVQTLECRQSQPFVHEHLSPLQYAAALLEECVPLGTLPFAIIARHAFIAEALMRSAVARGALAPERLDAFKRSLVTVAGELARDFYAVMTGSSAQKTFLACYGHLRPGTYDILSLRYDQRPDLFHTTHLPPAHTTPEPFLLSATEKAELEALIAEAGMEPLSPQTLLDYAARAIVQRERAKFLFTRHLSNALESIACWGEALGLTRDDLSYLTLDDILDTLHAPILHDRAATLRQQAESRRHIAEMTRGIRLGYILRDARDIDVVPLHRNAPNFVTTRAIAGQTVLLDGRMNNRMDLFHKIVCIENADPGFDWVFTRGIAGLISKFGGANSHMTIRCAELNLPAAIGVGEQTFERLVQAGCVELDCGAKSVRPATGAPVMDAVLSAPFPVPTRRAA